MTLINWHFLHTYKDVIANGLDLLSFILVTPQIVRAFATRSVFDAAMGLMGLIWAAFSIIFMLALPVFIIVALFGIQASQIANFLPYAVPLLIAFLAAIALVIYLIGFTLARLEPYALIVGIAVFFVSRIVALVIAVHELHQAAGAASP
jgi:hypothetical protein